MTLLQYDKMPPLLIRDYHFSMAEDFRELMFIGLRENTEVCMCHEVVSTIYLSITKLFRACFKIVLFSRPMWFSTRLTSFQIVSSLGLLTAWANISQLFCYNGT